MSASDSFEAGFLDLLFLNTACAGVGDVSGLQPSALAGAFYLMLYTADPGETGDQTTNECSYTGYARPSVVRTSSGWSRTDNVVTNVGTLSFGFNSGSTETATHFGIGTLSTGAGVLIVSGELNTPLAIVAGMTPQVLPGSLEVAFE